jgi:hypothetical protein
MDNFQLYDENKKGTIILSHYRSGGTQLLLTLTEMLKSNGIKISNFKELNFDTLSGKSYKTQTEEMLKHTNYATILLNNSLVISYFYNQGYFDELSKNYNLVILERKDKLMSLLSLPIWEELINKGLFHKDWKTPLEQTQDMVEFHNYLINHKIDCRKLHLGWENDMFRKSEDGHVNEYYYLNYLMKAYQDELNMLKILKSEYKLHTIYYEDYEFIPMNLSKYYEKFSESSKKKVLVKSQNKIPYIHRNFIDYFDIYTQKVLSDWNFDD